MMITFGASSLPFLQEIGQAYAAGPSVESLVEIATRHGVALANAGDGPGSGL